MSYASEKLHNGYLRRKMPVIVSNVKVREIIIHLPCLTDHDRETIEAKRETNGNFDGMVLLLECLKRRENWPEQLIEALEACEQPTIAAEIRAEYNALRGNSTPSSPSTTVVSAHVHPPPSASQQPVPQRGEKSLATVAPSAEASAPPEPVALPENPVQPQATPSAAQFPKAVSLSERVPEPPQSAQIEVEPLPSTPPPSPETQHTPAGTPVPPQKEVNAHQQPEENSESDIQDVADVISDPVSTGNREVSSMVTSPPSRPFEQPETETLPCTASLRTTPITEVRPPQSPTPTQTHSDVTGGSSYLTRTPEKPPVQDTTPPVNKVPDAVLKLEGTSDPQTSQVVESSRQTQKAASVCPLPGAAVMDTSLLDDNTVCLSKPGQLISIQPQNYHRPNIPTANAVEEPYSGNSERLEISDGAPNTVTSARSPVCSEVTSTTGNTALCQENGIHLNHNKPEENQYESPSQSLETQEVGEHVVHVSQEVSILNLQGQPSDPEAQMINTDTGKEIASASLFSTTTAETISSLNAHSSEEYHPSEPAPANTSLQLPDPETSGASCILTNNTKYILMAAGVGAFALLVAWKLKN